MAPCGTRIPQVPMLERKRKPAPQGCSLSENRQALLAAAAEPFQTLTMEIRHMRRGGNDVVQDRALRDRRQVLQEGAVFLHFACGLRNLDKALVSRSQHLR